MLSWRSASIIAAKDEGAPDKATSEGPVDARFFRVPALQRFTDPSRVRRGLLGSGEVVGGGGAGDESKAIEEEDDEARLCTGRVVDGGV